MRNLPRLLAPIAVVSLLALSACSTGSPGAEFDDAGASSPSATGNPAEDGATSGDGAGAGDQPAGTAGVDFPDPEAVVADATFTVPGTESDEVRFGIESIVVSGRTMELRLVMTPEFDDGGGAASVYDALGENVNITLIDRENLKEYRVLEADGGGRWFRTDPVYTEALPGQSVGYQVFFAAPEDEISTIDVRLTESWPVFEDVPLTVED
jgi:hypothetical protein